MLKLRKLKEVLGIKEESQRPTRNKIQYEYVSGKGKEYFRKNSRGSPLRITLGEAYQILELSDKGKSVRAIYNEIDWHHNTSESTIQTFLNCYQDGMFEDVFRRIQ